MTLVEEEEEREGDFYFSYMESESFYIAIIASRLYMHVYHRASGTSGDADGTWVNGARMRARGVEREGPHEYSGEFSEKVTAMLTISGDEYTIQMRDSWSESERGEGETYSESDTEEMEESGTVRIDGDRIFLTTTMIDGRALDSDEQLEYFLGWVVGDILGAGRDMETVEEPGPESYYERQ